MLESPALRSCLQLCLQVGNALNGGTSRGAARGFRIDVLPSLSAVKSSADTQYSLMHFLAAALDAEAGGDAARQGEEADGQARSSAEVRVRGSAAANVSAPRAAVSGFAWALASELSLLGSLGDGPELLASLEAQLSHLKAELAKCRAELSLLPPVPAAPAMTDGYPRLVALDAKRILVSFCADEVSIVRWVLLPAWKCEPSFHRSGVAQELPTAEQVHERPAPWGCVGHGLCQNPSGRPLRLCGGSARAAVRKLHMRIRHTYAAHACADLPIKCHAVSRCPAPRTASPLPQKSS